MYPQSNSGGRVFALICAFLLLLSVPSTGQERFGELNGTAIDPSGAVLPDVAVTATNISTQRAYTTGPAGMARISSGSSNREPTRSNSNCQGSRHIRWPRWN